MKADDVELEVRTTALVSFELDLGTSSQTDDREVPDSSFALSLPFEKQQGLNDERGQVPLEAGHGGLANLLKTGDDQELSAEVAARERVSRPKPVIYLPGNKQRTTRSVLTIVISAVAVLVLAIVGVLMSVKSQEATPEQRAFDAYVLRQLAVAKSDRALTATFERFVSDKSAAQSANIAAAAALATVVGVADEVSRAETETLRLTFEAVVAEISVTDPADTPYVAPNVTGESTLTSVAAEVEDLAVEAARIEDSQLQLELANQTLSEASSTFGGPFAEFAMTIPATAAALLGENSDAGQEWRDAVTNAVDALSAAVEIGLGANEMEAYAAAAFALQDENARALAERARAEAGEPDDDAPEPPPITGPSPQPGQIGPDTEPEFRMPIEAT